MKFLKFIIIIIGSLLSLSENCFANNDTTQAALPLGFSPQGMPFIEIEIQGKILPVIFDTGDSKGTFALSPLALQGLKVSFTNQTTCGNTTSGRICQKNIIIPEVKLGNLALYHVKSTLLEKLWGGDKGFIETPASKNGLIGLKALQNFGVLIDYPHSQVILTKNYQAPKGYDINHWVRIPFELKYGINTQAQINGVPVNLVWDTGPSFSVLKPNAKLNDKIINCSSSNNCPPDFPKGQDKALKTDSLTFNGNKIKNTWFEVSQVSFPFDGLLASNFFKNYIVFIDFKRKALFVQS